MANRTSFTTDTGQSSDKIEVSLVVPAERSGLFATGRSAERRLADYDNCLFDPGRGLLIRTLWYFLSLVLLESGWFPISSIKTRVLRLFGARIGSGLVIHPNVRIKYPWRLTVGDNCWIGREVWIDNLADVTLESDVCLSQGAYLCTGSHDHRSATFELKTGEIRILHGAWICCRAVVLGDSIVPRLHVVPAGDVFRSPSVDMVRRKPR